MKRETSVYERVMFFHGSRSPMFFAFNMEIEGIINESEFKIALDKVSKKHPLAAVRVENTIDKKQYISTDNVSKFKITKHNNKDWVNIITDDLTKPFDIIKGPMVRFHLIHKDNQTNLISIFHHAAGDGLSAVIFLNDIFKSLSNPDKVIKTRQNTFVYTDLIKNDILQKIIKKGPPDWLKNKDHLKTENERIPVPPYPHPDFALHFWEIQNNDTKKIIQTAKKNDVTVHALLGAVFLKTFSDEFGEKEGYKRIIQSPVNFRPYLTDEANDLYGLFNGIIKIEADCSPDKTIFDIAKEILKKQKDQFNDLEPISSHYYFNKYLLDEINDPEDFFSKRKSMPMDYDFSLSNLGRLTLNLNEIKYKIKSIYGPIFSAVRGERVIAVNTYNDKMHFTFIYDKDCFDHQIGLKIKNKALYYLKNIIN